MSSPVAVVMFGCLYCEQVKVFMDMLYNDKSFDKCFTCSMTCLLQNKSNMQNYGKIILGSIGVAIAFASTSSNIL